MSRILVIYGTTDGHTARVARFMGDRLRTRGADVQVFEARGTEPGPDDYDAVIVAASIHAGRYQHSVADWVRTHAHILRFKPTAFVSVCLAVLQDDETVRRELDGIMDRFLAETTWRPTLTKVVAGALLYTHYGWFTRLMMKRIAARAGGDTDTSRDYEYTDWKDLEEFTLRFAGLVDKVPAAGRAHAVA
jgi:menaquinone-dependent protoporphyrinogen oxidase